MEDTTNVRVTRLRRRLSVESEDASSPSTPSTPSKRRGRLAAKPQLDLIDENATATTTPRRSKKALQDVEEQEKPLTPSRRSSRIKSNTSETADDKPATPLKRSARIKSNTSILSESTVTESPRTRRAARRNSVAESDNESNLTPARITRTTTKDSTSSIETPSDKAKKSKHVTVEKVNDEETDNVNEAAQISPGSQRKSPRLLNKSHKTDSPSKQNDLQISDQNSLMNIEAYKINDTNKSKFTDKMITPNSEPIKELASEIDFVKNGDKVNTSVPKDCSYSKKQRQRTKSWTNKQDTSLNDHKFFSDNESVKKKKSIHQSFDINSLKSYAKQNAYNDTKIPISNSAEEKINKDDKNALLLNDFSPKKMEIQHSTIIDQVDSSSKPNSNLSATEQRMQSFTTQSVKPIIYVEDLEPDNSRGVNIEKNTDDQCVPVVNHTIENQSFVQNKAVEINVNVFAPKDTELRRASLKSECSEPMDIDETIKNNTSLIENKSSLLTQDINNQNYSYVTNNEEKLQSSKIHDKSGNEEKRTVIMSEIKDISSKENSCQSTKKSPKSTIKVVAISSDHESDMLRGFIKYNSLEESIDTPIKDKGSIKLSIQTSTPVMSAITTNKQQSIKTPNNSETVSDEPSFENESSDNKSNLFDEEANEASNDYESGDSQDEEEKKYAEENEIIEKGETLTSDDEISNDSNYEKDSFIVSSDEEDYELLSGSGDNLSLSDNELKMDKKSKDKYNKRKDKERKQISREMYEARHGLNDTNKKLDKSKRRRLSSSMLESADESLLKTKKNKKRMRLDSSHEISLVDTELDKSYKKNKIKRLSQSLSPSIDDRSDQKEITGIFNVSAENVKDPLSITLNNKSVENVDSLSTTLMSKDNDLETLKETNDTKENIEEVQVNENVTLQHFNETHDPLQVLEEDSSLSENEEIKQNYDNVLTSLNEKTEQSKIKKLDSSLNLDMKTKKNNSKSIIDELNVTQTKTKKPKPMKNLKKPVNQHSDESSSDCIDFKLIFNENSSDSQEINDNKENIQECIQLKKSGGNTNLRNSIATTDDDSNDIPHSNINENNAKAINNTSSNGENNSSESIKNQEEENAELANSSLLNISKIDKKKKKLSNSQTDLTNVQQTSDETINLSVPLLLKTPKSEKKKKKLSNSQTDLTNIQQTSDETINLAELLLLKTPKSEIIKKKMSNSQTDLTNIQRKTDETINVGELTLVKTPKSEKKKKKKLSESQTDLTNLSNGSAEETIDLGELPLFKTPKSEKKKKKLSVQTDENDDMSTSILPAKETSLGETSSIKTSKSGKKNKKSSSQADLPAEETINLGDLSLFKTPNSEKKKMTTESLAEANENERVDKSKRERNLSHSVNQETSNVPMGLQQTDVNKAKKRKWDIATQDEPMSKGILHSIDSLLLASKNKKQKLCTSNETIDKNQINRMKNDESTNIKSSTGEPLLKSQEKQITKINVKKLHTEKLSENKRQKKQLDNNTKDVALKKPMQRDVASTKGDSKEKGKVLKSEPPAVSDAVVGQTNINRKRKKRDEDNGENKTKVSKGNVTDKVHVPRLPEFILNQLDDEPTKEVQRKAKIVSTLELSAKHAKKNKPSNFLETTVCLNDSDEYDDKRIYNKPLNKPKILPSIPFALTSTSGSTTQFKISIIPRETKFVAQSTVSNSFNKHDYLREKQIKQKRKNYELYKNKMKSVKLSKF